MWLWRLTVFMRKYRHADIREGAVMPGFNIMVINEYGPVNVFSEKMHFLALYCHVGICA